MDEADLTATESIERERGRAIDLLDQALAILDRIGPLGAAATVSLAMSQAGRDAPPPPAG